MRRVNLNAPVVLFLMSAGVTIDCLHTQAEQSLPATPVTSADPQVGPETEKRFPPLKVSEGFRATLFACDPLVEYPSVIAKGPRLGTLFVAHDYVTGLGVEIIRRDEIRLLEDSDNDGYADQSTVFATGFNSIQGLDYHAGTVYVMHAPLLTSLGDTDGDGVADERRDLIDGLGLSPEENSNRLHCANGVVVGHDGWLYLALGDRGCDVKRPEGDRLTFQQGGILRCRGDGRDLHVFSKGLRNIYDIALDEHLNVFVRDNENDGGDYMIRVCHSFHGTDHGYPYLYYEKPAEAMPPLADLGRGSAAGGTSYLETAFPREYRQSLYFCEWGRAVVRYRLQKEGSGFASMTEIDFAFGAPDDPYGFKPTDLVVDYDGSMLISDWADGQRPKRGRGRIYRVQYDGQTHQPPLVSLNQTLRGTDIDQLFTQLNSESYHVRVAAQDAIQHAESRGISRLQEMISAGRLGKRARLHAIWILAHARQQRSIDTLMSIAESDRNIAVRVQALRAVADLSDPIITRHRLDAGRGDALLAARLSRLSTKREPRVMREVVIALGRLRWRGAPAWLRRNLPSPDPALAHAAIQTLRRADNWPAVLNLLGEPIADNEPSVRDLAIRAISGQANTLIVDGLIRRLQSESHPNTRRQYAHALARVYKKPAAWVYWGFRPEPRPANSIAWQRSDAIAEALDRVLLDADHDVRGYVLRQMLREEIPIRLATLQQWLREESEPSRVSAILDALIRRPGDPVTPLVEPIVRSSEQTERNRLTALTLMVRDLDQSNENQLIELAVQVEDGPVLAAVLREIGQRPQIFGNRLLTAKLQSPSPVVRSAAVRSLAKRQVHSAGAAIIPLLQDQSAEVMRAAALALGKLQAKEAAPMLLELANHEDPDLVSACLTSLRELNEPGAVDSALVALRHSEAQLAALSYLQNHGTSGHLDSAIEVASISRSSEVLRELIVTLLAWQQREPIDSTDFNRLGHAIARVQGISGVAWHWSTLGPISTDDASLQIKKITSDAAVRRGPLANDQWRDLIGTGTESQLRFNGTSDDSSQPVWLAITEITVSEETNIEFLGGSDGKLQIWLNGHAILRRDTPRSYQPNAERFTATLSRGLNQVLVRVDGTEKNTRFHLRFRRRSSMAEHERLTQLVLNASGNAQRGRELFFNAEKSLCLKCHRLGQQGERIGPDLTGIGSRFSRIHLIESILEPSRTVAPSYATVSLELRDGRVLTGVKLTETADSLTLGDAEGRTHVVASSNVETTQAQDQSTMPDGLEKKLTDSELVNLISFLLSQK